MTKRGGGFWLKLIIAVASAVAGAFGVQIM